MKRHYCTYFDRNYLFRGLALVDSLKRRENADFTLYVVCMDEITRVILNKIAHPNIVTVAMHEVESGDAALLQAKRERSTVEYLWTCTPTIILRVMERFPEIDLLTYLDADLYFFSTPQPIFDELGSRSILIHEHRFPFHQRHLEKWGKYNVGLLAFRRDTDGLEALHWWRDRCIEWCYMEPEDGKYGDQVYLNDWPQRFKNVTVLQHIGAGVAPWNHAQYRFTSPSFDYIEVNKEPLIFYHFHSLKIFGADCFVPLGDTGYPITLDLVRLCFIPYIEALLNAMQKVQPVLPTFSFGFSESKDLSAGHTLISSPQLSKDLRDMNIPQRPHELGEGWTCFGSEQLRDEEALFRASNPS